MNRIIIADAIDGLRQIDDESVDTCITSPPYFNLRDYGSENQIGLEKTPEEYIDRLVEVFREVKRVLKSDGTLWVVIGDCYAGSGKGRMKDGTHSTDKSKSSDYANIVGGHLTKTTAKGCKVKDLIGIPWMLAFALRTDGWYLRNNIIWNKPNVMPESVKDRCTCCHEHIFLLSKKRKYFFDKVAIEEPARPDGRKDTYFKGSGKYKQDPLVPGNRPQSHHIQGRPHERWRTKNGVHVRNKRNVWTIPTKAYKGAHFATFPPDLVKPCVLAGSRVGGIVLDPFAGSGTVAMVAQECGRQYIAIEINPQYKPLIEERLREEVADGEHSQSDRG